MRFIFSILLCLIIISCTKKLQEVDYLSHNCGKTPKFAQNIGFDLSRSGFSTQDEKKMGLHYIQVYPGTEVAEKMYQDSSWKKAGWMAAIVTDNKANTFCIPAPLINILNNPTKEQNNLYKVDANTGKMELFMQLPGIDEKNVENPFGLMGLAYNCESNVLYVSSVAASTRNEQKGKIYCIDIEKKKIIDTYASGDAFGIAVCYKDGYRKLYFGSARNSNVYTIGLKEDGTFIDKEDIAFSIEGVGPRGDDKVKKIREDRQGNLEVSAYEFNFNLTAPSEKQVVKYIYKYDAGQEKWLKQ